MCMWAVLKSSARQGVGKRPAAYKVGDRVRIDGPALPDPVMKGCIGTVVQVPAAPGPSFVVEVYAPAKGEENAMNPFLVRQRFAGLRFSQLHPAIRDEGGLTFVGRPGSSMVSVPLAELHCRGFGPNARNRSARLGGLSDQVELNSLTCTVQSGPNGDGRYAVAFSLDEDAERNVLWVRPECLTLRIRREAAKDLTQAVPGALRAAAWQPLEGQVAAETLAPAPSLALPSTAPKPAAIPQLPAAEVEDAPSARSTPRMSPAAAAALASAATAARRNKFDALDDDLTRHCVMGSSQPVPSLPQAGCGLAASAGLVPEPVVATLPKKSKQKASKRSSSEKIPGTSATEFELKDDAKAKSSIGVADAKAQQKAVAKPTPKHGEQSELKENTEYEFKTKAKAEGKLQFSHVQLKKEGMEGEEAEVKAEKKTRRSASEKAQRKQKRAEVSEQENTLSSA